MVFLNEIVGNAETTQANQILDQLREHVKNALNQSESTHKLSDGMDLALCVIDVESKNLQFSGANNPLYIVRKSKQLNDNNHQLIHLKPDRQPIGAFIKEQPFTNHHFELQADDTLYLFSDGIIDQFGGEYSDKYKSQRFKKLLIEIQNQPLATQKELILEAYENWKGRIKQVDDIVVLGIKPL
jgi:serine phosphatase RsbU (regulator of sigma subunit)